MLNNFTFLEAVTTGRLSDLLTMIRAAQEKNPDASLDDLAASIEYVLGAKGKEVNPPPPRKMANSIVCKICNHPVKLLKVNDSTTTQIGGDYQAMTLCTNRDCLHTEFYTDPLTVLSKKLGLFISGGS